MRVVLLGLAIVKVAALSSLRARSHAPLAPTDSDFVGSDPLSSISHPLRLAQLGSGKDTALPKWLEKPPWWLPTPPEWGPPPAHMYGSWYDPRNIPQVSGAAFKASRPLQATTPCSVQPIFRANPYIWRSGFYSSAGSVSADVAPSPFGWNGGAFAPQVLPPFAPGSYLELDRTTRAMEGAASAGSNGMRGDTASPQAREIHPRQRRLRGS